MGKNKTIKTLGKRIGNIVLHKLLVKYTNKPESRGHLQSEEGVYRDQAIKDARKYNWNEKDKQALKILAIAFVKEKKDKKYPDVIFPLSEPERLAEEEIIGLKL